MSGHWNILSSSIAGALIGYVLTMPLLISEQSAGATHILWSAFIEGQAMIALCALAGGLLSLATIRARQRQRIRLVAIRLEQAKQQENYIFA